MSVLVIRLKIACLLIVRMIVNVSQNVKATNKERAKDWGKKCKKL